ncbi:MAG: hypothetical protein ACMG57_04435, partial [Candidatus Dojkabacteria bacterium]
MDNASTQPQSNSLAGNITSQSQDPFDVKSEGSEETKLLVQKIEEKESGITPAAKVVKTSPKNETFLDRLLINAGLKGTTAGVSPKSSTPSKSSNSVTPTLPRIKPDFSKFTRAFLIGLIVLTLLFGLYLLLYFTNIDTQILKISLNGTVTNTADGKPLEGAELFVDNSSVGKTDSNGKYSIKINNLKFNLKATLKDFTDYQEDINVPRSILSYSFTKNITLTSSKVAKVVGKFVTDDPKYKFSDDKLFFNDEEFVLNDDGTFDLSLVPTGQVKLVFESVNFKDITQELTLNPGNNTIKEIKVTPAGDAVGSVISFVREDMVLNTKFTIENVQDNQILINDQGKFRVMDLDVGRTYKI